MNEDDRVELDSGLRCNLDGAIGGTYNLPDGREFWMDAAAVRAVLSRIEPVIGSWLEANTRASLQGADTVTEAMIEAGVREQGLPYACDMGWERKKIARIYTAMRTATRLSADHTAVLVEVLKEVRHMARDGQRRNAIIEYIDIQLAARGEQSPKASGGE